MNHYIHFDEASMSEGSVSHDHELGEDDPRPEAGSAMLSARALMGR